ncbi:ubiquinone biosynthesis hydrox [Imleria badia]|nr:ubiquinone biosynthesis hydrox [Imleria badia]
MASMTTLSKRVLCRISCQRKALCRAFSTESIQDKDVVIVGGGPVGLALASALGSNPLVRESIKVALIDAGDLSKIRDWSLPADTFSNRVSSITNTSRSFLEDIGAWAYVDGSRTSAIREMQVWDGISDARIIFDAAELPSAASAAGSSEMARLTENLNLQRAFLRHLENSQGVQLLQKVKVESIRPDVEGNGWPLVHLSDGTTIRARLLVGADGFNSPVRSYAGISSYGWSYDTQAVVATLNHAPRGAFEKPNHTAYQRFLPTGPIAFLPLSPTVSSLVWATRPRHAAALCKSDPAVLASMINAAYRLPDVSIRYLHDRILEADAAGQSLSHEALSDEISFRERSHAISKYSAYATTTSALSGGIPPSDAESIPPLVTSIQADTIASFPLRYSHAEAYLGEGAGSRTVLVGDAAHTMHPLAGQGLNLGLGDIECLARCIAQTLRHGGDIGSYTALRPYASERYFENHKVMASVDKLHRLYASTLEPIVWARSVGLEVLNELDTVKAALMMEAGGRSTGSGWEWNLLARGVEGLATGLSAARMLRERIGSASFLR